MRVGLVALPMALMLLVPSQGAAQTRQSFQDLALRLNLDDRLRIEDESGTTTTGRLTHLTRDEITIQTDAGEKRFTSATVRTVARRRDTRRKNVLIGAGVGAIVGALAACSGPDRQECADGPILLGGVGAGVGLALSALIPRSTTVYTSAIDMAPAGGLAQAPGVFDSLALRVNLDDRIRVEDRSGARTTGRLLRLTGDEMTVGTDAGEKRFTRDDVRAVAVRGYPLGIGALIGAGVVTAALAASPGCRSDPDCIPIAAAPFGAGVGLAVGALIPRMKTVFRMQETQASFSPEFSRGAVGIRASFQW
jgi:hypothetical protein